MKMQDAEGKIWNDTISELIAAQERYKAKFGVDSLDYATICDPLNSDIEEMKIAIKRLNRAIDTGRPYPNIPPMPGLIY